MKKRISLADKIQFCMKYGTLKTYSETEAIAHFCEYYNEGEIDGIIASYEAGKYLSGFIANSEYNETIYQIGNFPFFVKEVVYPLMKINHENIDS
jgi:hypothetical protein